MILVKKKKKKKNGDYIPDPVTQRACVFACVSVIAGSPWRPYGFIMEDADLVHFTAAVDTFHKSERGESARRQKTDVQKLVQWKHHTRGNNPLDSSRTFNTIMALKWVKKGYIQLGVKRVVLLPLELVFVDGAVGKNQKEPAVINSALCRLQAAFPSFGNVYNKFKMCPLPQHFPSTCSHPDHLSWKTKQ